MTILPCIFKELLHAYRILGAIHEISRRYIIFLIVEVRKLCGRALNSEDLISSLTSSLSLHNTGLLNGIYVKVPSNSVLS